MPMTIRRNTMSLTTAKSYISFQEMQNLHLYAHNNNTKAHRVETAMAKDTAPDLRNRLLAILGLKASDGLDASIGNLITRRAGNRTSRGYGWDYWHPDDIERRDGKVVPIIVPTSTDPYYGSNENTPLPSLSTSFSGYVKDFLLCSEVDGGYHYWKDTLTNGCARCIVTVAPSPHLSIGESVVALNAAPIGEEVTFLMPVPVAEELFGFTLITGENNVITVKLANGQTFSVADDFCTTLAAPGRYNQASVFNQLRKAANQNTILARHLKAAKGTGQPQSLKGIQKTWKKINGLLQGLSDANPKAYTAFSYFASMAGKTIDKVGVSTVFNLALKDATTVEELEAALKPLTESLGERDYGWFEEGLKAMPQYLTKRKATLKSQTKRAHSKLMQDMEFIEIDETQFPLTHKFVSEGRIPLSTFFSKKEQYFLFNNNWALWEKMLELYPDVTVSLAKEVSTRTTYAKDLMSYFYHVLYDLPEYLEEHTGHAWVCKPKLLNDSSALDSSSMAEGVSKERSAMTPIVDNDARTVVVPFISVYMPGRFSVYCYAHQYNVLRRGVMHDGSAVTKDIEEKLNGKDDYGLMFYTLIGTSRGTGYPAFLIIFERLSAGTRVHIHRVNPCRSKDGDKLAIHDWTKNCYNWMAGNVRSDRIKTTQGDLMFVEIEDEVKREFTTEVNNFDSHSFDKAVAFCTDVPKSQKNLLGYAQLQADTWLRHPEHEDRYLQMGAYEIRQARSYENNPAGSWSLTID
jgi:hypothetical protein